MVKIDKKNKVGKTKTRKPKLHLGLCQSGIDIEKKLGQLSLKSEIVIHRFDTPDQLFEHNHRSYIDLVVMASGEERDWIGDMIRRIKAHSTLNYIPILVYSPGSDKKSIIAWLKEGADEITADNWDKELIAAKAEMLVHRSQRDLSINPSTKLPGPNAIEFEVDRRLRSDEKFAVCYVDLDNFKAYNDYYGYVYGDKVIRITSHIIRSVVQDLTPDGFVGHIGGDDFIVIIPPEMIDPVCQNIISTFDRMAPFRYEEADRDRGWIEVANRRGEVERFPIFSITIAVIINQKRLFKHPGEMSHMMADLKKYTKTLPGSNYMVERRQKY